MRTDFAVHTRIKADDMASPAMRRIADQAKRTARSFRGLNGLANTLRGIGRLAGPIERAFKAAGAAGVIAGGAALALANKYATARDEQAKFARQIGFSADSLDRLSFIADRQGANFENLQSGLTAFTKRVGELRAGTGSLNAILSKTDPAFAELLKNTKDNEAAFELFLGKVASLPDEQAKAALAAAGVSRGAMGEIIRLTDGGVEAFKQLRMEADKFRAPIRPNDLRNAEAYKDAQTNVSFALRGVADTIGSRVVPVLTPFLNRLADWIAANRELIGQKMDEYSARIATALEGVDFDAVAKGIGSFVDGIGRFMSRAGEIIDSLGGMEKILKGVGIAWLALKGLSLASLVVRAGVQAASIVSAIGSIALASTATRKTADGDFDAVGKRFSKLRALMKGGLAIGIAGGAIAGLSSVVSAMSEAADKAEADASRFSEAYRKITNPEGLGESVRVGGVEIPSLPSPIEVFGDLQQSVRKLFSGSDPIAVPVAPVMAAGAAMPTGARVPRVAPQPGSEVAQTPARRGGARVPQPVPVSPASSKTDVNVNLRLENDSTISVRQTGVEVRRRRGFANVGVTMDEQN